MRPQAFLTSAVAALLSLSCADADTAPVAPEAYDIGPATPTDLIANDFIAPNPLQDSVDTHYVEPSGTVIPVGAGDNLQAAINAAEPGDVVELQAGATFTGNFELPAKDGTEWIVIRSSAMGLLPGEGERVGPDDAPNMPRIVSPDVHRAITVEPGASHYRLMGLEITVEQEEPLTYSIVDVATGSTDIILDRLYVHGHPDLDFQRCIILNGERVAVINSYISECHSSGFDSQAILAWDTPGPLKIVNNYLEGAGENVMIGGARPATGVVPSDIEIRGNHFRKPAEWREPDRWSVKNLLEVKFGRRILVEGNVFENNWSDSQDGTAIVLKHDVDDAMDWTVAEDITFRNNRITGTYSGFGLSSASSPELRRVWISNNYLEVEHRALVGIDGVSDVHFTFNTVLAAPTETDGEYQNMVILDSGGAPGLVMVGNLFGPAAYGVGGNDLYADDYLDERAPGHTTLSNAFVDRNGGGYPAGNEFPSAVADVLDGFGVDAAVLDSLLLSVVSLVDSSE